MPTFSIVSVAVSGPFGMRSGITVKPLIRRLRRYDGKVRAKIFFGAEGMTSDQSTFNCTAQM
eukprot:5761894-Pyramimonas_sp.AAC.2